MTALAERLACLEAALAAITDDVELLVATVLGAEVGPDRQVLDEVATIANSLHVLTLRAKDCIA